jgi:hypothetical protein
VGKSEILELPYKSREGRAAAELTVLAEDASSASTVTKAGVRSDGFAAFMQVQDVVKTITSI